MKYYKFALTGHVHNNPDRVVTSIHSIPTGVTFDYVLNKISGFGKAFNLTKCEFS